MDTRGFINGFQILQIVIVTNEDEKKGFVEEVGEEAVPVEYGGKAKLTPIQDSNEEEKTNNRVLPATKSSPSQHFHYSIFRRHNQ
ncbi:putative aspartate semialdehyde dehydrogenase [Corchorus olitorius]|uniref:Aspartate semialdehyde dehydrogenase n=1 Tax=Corchorus olitorius TaxID=93759 RepID=A0A1R3JGJ6_9ROSI|nr:putative aspartate semialdehyde dehydrogenase [Corchorus olitorius]